MITPTRDRLAIVEIPFEQESQTESGIVLRSFRPPFTRKGVVRFSGPEATVAAGATVIWPRNLNMTQIVRGDETFCFISQKDLIAEIEEERAA